MSPGIAAIDREIFAGLDTAPGELEFYVENLDTDLFPGDSTRLEYGKWYSRKYSYHHPDIIIAIGPSAVRFLTDSKEKLFPGTPVVFCGSTEEGADNPQLDSEFTGVWEAVHPERTLDAALRLQPRTAHVVVVGGVSSYDRHLETLVEQAFRSYGSKLDFTYLTGLPTPVLLERLKHLQPNTIVYYTSFSEDAAGTHFVNSGQFAAMVARAASAPVFAMDDLDVGSGTVGGDVFSFAEQGKVAAAMAAKILGGKKPRDIPSIRSADTYVFDWKALRRWELKQGDLPAGSVVLNRQPGFWESYKRYFIAGLVVLLVQALLIVALLLERRKGKKTGEELLRANAQLRLAMESGKSVGWEWDLARSEGIWFGDLRTMLGMASDTFVCKVGDFFDYVYPEDRKRLAEEIADSKRSHRSCSAEFRVIRTDGSIRWVGSRGSFEYALNGEAKRAVGMAVDITERKQVEEALKDSEEKFSKAFHESPLAVTLRSAVDYHYIEVNETFERLTGWSAAEVLGRNPFEMGIWVDPAQIEDFEKGLRAEGSVRNVEITIRRKDGAIRSVLKSAESIEIRGEPCILFVTTDITDQKQIQQKLRDSQNRLENIVQSAMDAIIAIDDEMRIVLFNTAAENMFGLPLSDALGSTIDRFIPERFREAHKGHVRLHAKTGATNRTPGDLGTLWGVRANGEEFPIEASISQVEIGDKKLFTAIVRDITERVGAEKVQRRLAAIVYTSEDAILSVSPDGLIESWNPSAQRMYGYSEAEAVGHSIMLIVPAELRGEEAEILRQLKDGKAIEHRETVRLTKQGRRLDVSLTLSPIRDSAGKVVGISKIARDITEQKRAEQSLRESEERFRRVANTAPVLIWMSGPDKLCTYFNGPWLSFTGRSFQQEFGNGWAEGVHPDDLEGCWKTYEGAFDKREPFQMEYRLRRHDGEYRWIFDHGVPRFNSDGSFAGYIGSCIDNTERRLAQELLSRMSRKLIEAHEEERTWIARELHDDINQKIALLAVHLDQIKQELSPRPAIGQEFEDVCARVAEIGSAVQALSHRLHSSKLEYLGISTAAASFCRELAQKHRVQVDFRSGAIPTEIPKETALCLFRVLQEALQNAMKHSGTQHFEVSLIGRPNIIELTVRDWGIGFSPEQATQKYGLGLTSMRERLRLVDGELFIDSPDGGGTSIRATVPLGTYRTAKA